MLSSSIIIEIETIFQKVETMNVMKESKEIFEKLQDKFSWVIKKEDANSKIKLSM